MNKREMGLKKLLFLSSLLTLLWGVGLGAGEGKVEEYHKRYLENMEEIKCHPGFSGLSPKIKTAAQVCSMQKDIASYLCFVTCTYRGFNYIVGGKDDELDFAMADTVTMESFAMHTKEGRDSYWKLALNRYFCGRDYISTKSAKFATKYDNADACEDAEEFFKCSFKSLTCNSKAAAKTN